MESQEKFDFAVFGEGLAGWVGALLLAKQGERVLIIPEKRSSKEISGRILLGLEPDGIFLQMFERWGISKTILNHHRHARIECLTQDSSMWLQGSLNEQSLGSPGFEMGGTNYDNLLKVVRTLEESTEWKKDIEQEFIKLVRLTTDKRMNRIPLLPGSAYLWKYATRKVLKSKVKGVRNPGGCQIQGLQHLMNRDGPESAKVSDGLALASGISALRNAYFTEEIFKSLKEEFRRVLIATGVEFLPEAVHPEFKLDSSGEWEGYYHNEKNEISHFQFDNLILARQLGQKMLDRFTVGSQKVLLPDFQIEEFDYYEAELRFKENPFPFSEAAELVSRSLSGDWVRLSVYQTPATSVKVGVSIPVNGISPKSDSMITAEKRLLRAIKESLPGLVIDLENSEVTTDVYREKRFKKGIGTRGSSDRVWHAHDQSYPNLGEYGPVIAAIEIARLRARKKRRMFPI